MQREQDLVARVLAQEGVQQVLLGEVRAPSEPQVRVLVREEDVVEVHDDPRGEPRQNVQDDPVDLASELHGVGCVEEQDVACLDSSSGSSCAGQTRWRVVAGSAIRGSGSTAVSTPGWPSEAFTASAAADTRVE